MTGAGELARTLTVPGPLRTSLRQGVVASVQATTCTITLGGGATSIAGVVYLDSYLPTVGDTVWILQSGPDLLIVGRAGGAGPAVIPQIIEAQCSADYTVPFAEGDVTGASIGFNTTVVNARCKFDIVFDFNDVVHGGVQICIGKLAVDGTPQTPAAIVVHQAANDRATVAQTFKIILAAAGAHTVKLRAVKAYNYGTHTAIAQHTRLTGVVFG
jgi:hypothetical protein